MKMHYRRIDRKSIAEFRVACGSDVHWTKDTTSDKAAVTCARCIKFIEKKAAMAGREGE